MKAIRTYCKADVERLCPNVQPGDGRIKVCLMSNKEQMSVGCAQALQKLKSQQ
ncbi:MAG: cysteine rich repeat-containing protein [bacterium]